MANHKPANAIPLAEIRALEHPHYRQIMNIQTLLMCNVLVFVPLLFSLGGIVMALTAVRWWASSHEQAAKVDDSKKVPLYIAMIAVGVLLGAGGTYLQFRNGTYIANRYLRRVARKEIRRRPNPLVDPDDPESVFVEIVPRKNWGRTMLETASDVGYFLVDQSRGELRFEGNCETYRIPGSAITYCEIEEVVFGLGITIYPTVVGAEIPLGPWEAPIVFRGDLGILGAEKRRQRAEEMREKILSIIASPDRQPTGQA